MANSTESQDLAFQLNDFYRNNYRRTMKWLSFMVVVCAILSVILAWISFDKKQPPYYAAMTTGEVVPMHALSEPVVTSDFILQWSALTTRSIYNLDFSKYQQQLDEVKSRFTADGWLKMNAALKQSGLLTELVNSHLIITSVVSGTPVILERMIVNGRFTWQVQMRLLVTYTSASAKRQNELVITMNIQRVPTLNAPQGIQIIDFHSALAGS